MQELTWKVKPAENSDPWPSHPAAAKTLIA